MFRRKKRTPKYLYRKRYQLRFGETALDENNEITPEYRREIKELEATKAFVRLFGVEPDALESYLRKENDEPFHGDIYTKDEIFEVLVKKGFVEKGLFWKLRANSILQNKFLVTPDDYYRFKKRVYPDKSVDYQLCLVMPVIFP